MELTGYGRMVLKCHSKRGKLHLLLGFRQEQRRENAWGATAACLIGASAFRHRGESLHIRMIRPILAY